MADSQTEPTDPLYRTVLKRLGIVLERLYKNPGDRTFVAQAQAILAIFDDSNEAKKIIAGLQALQEKYPRFARNEGTGFYMNQSIRFLTRSALR